jgi:hypothetical protein
MMSLSGSLRLRPTRVGFLVDPHDMESLSRIFQVCTCSWGGVFNPIIPICTTIPDAWADYPFPDPSPADLARGYIEFFEPDIFVEARPGLAAQIGLSWADLDFGHPRMVSLDSYFIKDDHHPFSMPFGTDSFDIYKALYEREFKFVSRHERRVALFEADPVASAFTEAAFGGFPSEGPLKSLADAYVDAFDPVKLVPNAENWIKVIREGYRPPLSFTMEGLKREPSGWDEPTLFIADPTSSLDLIDLWNLRQFRSQVLPVNLAWVQESQEYLTELVRASYGPLPGNPNGVMIRTSIEFGRSVVPRDRQQAVERASAILENTGIRQLPESPWSMKLWYDRIWVNNRDDSHGPQRAEISAASSDLDLTVSEDSSGPTCQFTSLAPDFSSMYGSHSAARWVNVLKPRSYGGHDALALTLPSSFANDRHRGLRLSDSTIVSREGFVLPQKYKHHREYFRLLTGQEAMISWLKQNGVDAQPSDPGRIADQILSSLKGFFGTNLLADPDTLKLLDKMSKSVKETTPGRIEEFPDRSMAVRSWINHIKTKQQSGSHSFDGINLDAFIDANIFKLGLIVTCMHCRKENWFSIDHLTTQLTCERCLKAYPFPQASLDFQNSPWHYRVIGPYSIPNFAEGAYSTVLALSVFARRLGGGMPNLTYSTNLKCKVGNEDLCEIDFSFWYQRDRMFGREEEPALVFGEAKSFAIESFKENDVARMRNLAEIFPGAFMVFATLKDELSLDEITRIGDFAVWGRERLPNGWPRAPVIVLTAAELFCEWGVEHTWKEIGGQRAALLQSQNLHMDNLRTLADLTQQAYLGLPDPLAKFREHALATSQPTEPASGLPSDS